MRLTGDRLPEIKHVAHTNFCDIGWKVDEATGRLIVVAVLDNLLKGAAGQAIQQFNLLLRVRRSRRACCERWRRCVVKFGGELVETPRTSRRGRRRPWSALAAAGSARGGARRRPRDRRGTGAARRAEAVGRRPAHHRCRRRSTPWSRCSAGTINTRLVAHLVGLGLDAVGLTGVDAALARATRAAAHVTAAGAQVDLGLVGEPDADADLGVVSHLLAGGYVPVIASLGI